MGRQGSTVELWQLARKLPGYRKTSRLCFGLESESDIRQADEPMAGLCQAKGAKEPVRSVSDAAVGS